MTMTIALIAYALATLADTVTTYKALRSNPNAEEANGIMAKVMQKFGKGWIAVKFGGSAVAAYFLWADGQVELLAGLAALLFFVSYRNYKFIK